MKRLLLAVEIGSASLAVRAQKRSISSDSSSSTSQASPSGSLFGLDLSGKTQVPTMYNKAKRFEPVGGDIKGNGMDLGLLNYTNPSRQEFQEIYEQTKPSDPVFWAKLLAGLALMAACWEALFRFIQRPIDSKSEPKRTT